MKQSKNEKIAMREQAKRDMLKQLAEITERVESGLCSALVVFEASDYQTEGGHLPSTGINATQAGAFSKRIHRDLILTMVKTGEVIMAEEMN